MTENEILTWLKAERLSVADFLSELTESEWQVDSLCPGWTVRDVAAHLTMSTRLTMRITIIGILKARGNWNRMTAGIARDRAARFTTDEIIAQIRETAGSGQRAPGAGPLDPLVD
ncbi:maleylpyruvate isomerase N-terminal domain-containing protein, partial [Actinomadura adrarensis]